MDKREVKGIRAAEIATLNREWRETVAQGVNGHVKISRSGKLPETESAGGSPAGGPTGIVWEKWPDDQQAEASD